MSPGAIGKNVARTLGAQILPTNVEMPDRDMAPALQIGRMSVPPDVDCERNDWYNGACIPGYRKVPGVIYARRFRVVEGSSPRSARMREVMTHAPGSPGVYRRIDS